MKRDRQLHIRLSGEEFERIRDGAGRAGLGMSDWVRGRVLRTGWLPPVAEGHKLNSKAIVKKVGRGEAGERKTKYLQVRLTPGDHRALRVLAGEGGISEWVRGCILREGGVGGSAWRKKVKRMGVRGLWLLRHGGEDWEERLEELFERMKGLGGER